MLLEQTTLQVAYAVSVITSIALCAILWRHRTKRGAIPLFCYVFSGLLWGGNQLVNVTVDDYAVSAALYRFLYVGIAVGVAALFVFALEYTGRERYLRPKTYLALSIHPIYVLVFVIADPGGLFFGTIESDPASIIGVSPTYGIAMLIHLVYAYALVVASVLMFIDMLYRTRSLYRGQSIALIGGSLLPAGPPLAALTGVTEFDATPLAIPIASALFTVAIVRYRLIDLVPIARDRVLDNVNDGVFVVDADDRLIDVNPEGERVLQAIGVDDRTPVGERFPDLLGVPALRDQYETMTETATESTGEASIDDNHFQVAVTPIDDGRGHHVGWLLIAHDITERKRRERRLKRQNERLEQFADFVAHDLRNPLNVADGYLDLARETDDDEQLLERIARSHDRMETIIDDVLTLTREGDDVTDPEPVDLATVADRAWESVETDDVNLAVRSDATILVDPERLRRLLENLFRNAVEHGTPNFDSTNAPLTVTVGSHRDEASDRTVFVEDDGIGISPDRRDTIFEDGVTGTDEGTGLGLSIVRRIAEAHGWSVAATEGTDGGARFEFSGVEVAADETGTGDGAPEPDENEDGDGSLETPSPSGDSS